MKIKNGIRYEKNGWTYLSLKGSPSAMGYAHGYLVAKELKEIFKMLDFTLYEDYGYKRELFSDIVGGIWGRLLRKITPSITKKLPGLPKARMLVVARYPWMIC
jgi:hypothetical protein